LISSETDDISEIIVPAEIKKVVKPEENQL
jgi:hypothetical protein